jgi:hypothetical protein
MLVESLSDRESLGEGPSLADQVGHDPIHGIKFGPLKPKPLDAVPMFKLSQAQRRRGQTGGDEFAPDLTILAVAFIYVYLIAAKDDRHRDVLHFHFALLGGWKSPPKLPFLPKPAITAFVAGDSGHDN